MARFLYRDHPECRFDEVFLGNMEPSFQHETGFKTVRRGRIRVDIFGVPRNCDAWPFFVKKAELESRGIFPLPTFEERLRKFSPEVCQWACYTTAWEFNAEVMVFCEKYPKAWEIFSQQNFVRLLGSYLNSYAADELKRQLIVEKVSRLCLEAPEMPVVHRHPAHN